MTAEFTTSLTPLASGAHMPDSTADESFALAELLQKIFIRGKIVNLDSLCIVEGKAVWALKVDVVATSVDGSILDTAVLAAGAALRRTQLPGVVVASSGKVHLAPSTEVIAKEGLRVLETPLSVAEAPLCFTFGRVASKWLLDPSSEEASVSDATVQVAIRFPSDATGSEAICLLHSSGTAPCAVDELMACATTASDFAQTVRKQLHKD
jgi:exosome complex RNA-binding protein Rrp42 (RNase PH superfamily)